MSSKHKQLNEKPRKHKRESSLTESPSPSASPRPSSSKVLKKKSKASLSPLSSDDDDRDVKKPNLKKRKKSSCSPEQYSERLKSTSSPQRNYSRHSPPPSRSSRRSPLPSYSSHRSPPPSRSSHRSPPPSRSSRYDSHYDSHYDSRRDHSHYDYHRPSSHDDRYDSHHYDSYHRYPQYSQSSKYGYPEYNSRPFRRHSPPPVISSSLTQEQIDSSKKMFLGNLPYEITETRLINDIINQLRIDYDDDDDSHPLFSTHITQIEFCTNERTKRRKGHVFITFDSHENAVRFMQSVKRDGGFQCDRRTLKVDWGVDQGDEGKVHVITEGGEGKIRVVEKVVPYLGVWKGDDNNDRRRGREEDGEKRRDRDRDRDDDGGKDKSRDSK